MVDGLFSQTLSNGSLCAQTAAGPVTKDETIYMYMD